MLLHWSDLWNFSWVGVQRTTVHQGTVTRGYENSFWTFAIKYLHNFFHLAKIWKYLENMQAEIRLQPKDI